MVMRVDMQRRVQASKKAGRVRAEQRARRAASRMPLPVPLAFDANHVQTPVHVVSEANQRDGWRKAHERAARQREDVQAVLQAIRAKPPALPCVVTLTRIGGQQLDDDNLARAFKAVRDEVAAWLGVDDGERSRVRFTYDQRPGPTWRHFGIVIAWWPLELSGARIAAELGAAPHVSRARARVESDG